MDLRDDLWHSLNSVLNGLSHKHTLVLMGDFNTTLSRKCSAVGSATFTSEGVQCRGPQHTDSHRLQNILTIHDLLALNTWTPQNSHTFQFDDRRSRIDFICGRKHFADKTAMNVQHLWQFPLLGLTGAQHVPQLCSILKVWFPPPAPRAAGWSRSQRMELGRQWTKPNERTFSLQSDILQAVSTLETHGDRLDNVHKVLNSFQPEQTIKTKSPIHQFDVTPFQRFQAHTNALRQLRGHGLHTWFQAWYHVLHRTLARTQMRITSTTARKRRLQQVYAAADQADQAKDHFKLYQAIRELSPKQPFRRIQLRATDGTVLTPHQEADWICQWFTELYADEAG